MRVRSSPAVSCRTTTSCIRHAPTCSVGLDAVTRHEPHTSRRARLRNPTHRYVIWKNGSTNSAEDFFDSVSKIALADRLADERCPIPGPSPILRHEIHLPRLY